MNRVEQARELLGDQYVIEPKYITCEVIKQVGYHDIHQVGDIISVNRDHLDKMLVGGYVRVVGSDD